MTRRLEIQRLEQTYERLPDGAHGHQRYAYASPSFGFRAVLEYDRSGLVVAYPGIAQRVG